MKRGAAVAVSFLIIYGVGVAAFRAGMLDRAVYGPSSVSVEARNNRWFPGRIEIRGEVGSEAVIVVRNADEGVRHDFAIDAVGVGTPVIMPGKPLVVRFPVAAHGEEEFRCTIHPLMVGRIAFVPD